jgi:glycosyltransferase involved in cell wall biosynthesis
VIAFKEGGAKDYVFDKKNGLLFEKQTVNSLAEAIVEFEKMKFDRKKVSETADGFSGKRFDKELTDYAKECLNERKK